MVLRVVVVVVTSCGWSLSWWGLVVLCSGFSGCFGSEWLGL